MFLSLRQANENCYYPEWRIENEEHGVGRVGWGASSNKGSDSRCWGKGKQATICGGTMGVVHQLFAKTSPVLNLLFSQSHVMVVIKWEAKLSEVHLLLEILGCLRHCAIPPVRATGTQWEPPTVERTEVGTRSFKARKNHHIFFRRSWRLRWEKRHHMVFCGSNTPWKAFL